LIDREHELPIARQAEALNVSRGSVYYLPGRRKPISRSMRPSAFVEILLIEIASCLENGEPVKLASFGSFLVRNKAGASAATQKPASHFQLPSVAS
jgi:hypothetical protein